MNENIHANTRFWNFGLIRINMSLNVETCVQGLYDRLYQFSNWYEDDEDDKDLESGLAIESEYASDLIDDHNFKDIIRRVRKVVIIIKRSSLTNDMILQKYVSTAHWKEIYLLLDSKTRWNSLFTILERFSLLKDSIQKALIDLRNPVQSDIKVINDIINVLALVKLTVENRKHKILLRRAKNVSLCKESFDKNYNFSRQF